MAVSGIIAAVKEKAAKRRQRDINAIVSAPARSRHAAPPAPAPPARTSITAPPLPEEGVRVTATAPQPPVAQESADTTDTAAHRERWRRAFIDSEILARKF
ncbi:MAG: hypothetical protein K2I18_05190 [Paramuribaculum sp.]|nr:hypothetical protein [Paramuribaculum sp.]